MSAAGGMVLVANPHATRHDRAALDEVARACERHMDVAVVMTPGRTDWEVVGRFDRFPRTR